MDMLYYNKTKKMKRTSRISLRIYRHAENQSHTPPSLHSLFDYRISCTRTRPRHSRCNLKRGKRIKHSLKQNYQKQETVRKQKEERIRILSKLPHQVHVCCYPNH